MRREELLVDNTLSSLVSSHTLSALFLEALLDIDIHCVASKAAIEGDKASILYHCKREPSQNDIDEVLAFIERVTRLHVNALHVSEPARHELRSHVEHLHEARLYFRELVLKTLKPYLAVNREYMLVLLWRGIGVIAEGERDKVHIPGSRYVATAHTHPGSLCLPSGRDLEAAAALLADGGCCTAILAPSCLLLIARRDTLSLDDYDTLLALARHVDKMSFEKLLQKLSMLASTSKTITIQLLSL
ncbi:hypothetical protein Pyrfu_1545 [Pyrolobus fumarii 1A]|uniref:Uncharacterized protein n=2 Tax=Pyrolobus fumarii TaxID=54252 RepID=G0EHP9_PYRF1|nr:hypothetical protein Pyrfu_1545 [Pyrolobus fumarii 1A]